MALIRHATAKTLARDAMVLDLGDLTRQAEQIRARARAESELILAQARAERERIVAGAAEEGRVEGMARGLEEGRLEGHAAGRDAAMAEYSQALGALNESWSLALAEFERKREEMLAGARQDVLHLALRIGEMVTKRAIEARPEVVVDQLAAVLDVVLRPTGLVVAAHPDDLPLLQAALPALGARIQGSSHIRLVGDPSLERGSCVAGVHRTGTGEEEAQGGGEGDGASSVVPWSGGRGSQIDASIATQLQRIVEALLPGAAMGPEASHPEPERGL
jgi:flagellar biosynthesis/type III secretory pathway protein FliH